MSLLAYRADTHEEVESFSFTCEQWKEMKSKPAGSYLMPQTRWPAVLKTSRYGTQFFAHKPGYIGDRPKQERVSAEHIKVQVELVTALRSAGYIAKVEHRGADVDGQQWIADVYFEADERKIAIEVQLSNQHFDEYFRRTERYNRSGIKCLWLLSTKNFLCLTRDFIARKKIDVQKCHSVPRSFQELAYLPLDFEDGEIIKVAVFPDGNSCERINLGEFAIGLAQKRLFYSKQDSEWAWKNG